MGGLITIGLKKNIPLEVIIDLHNQGLYDAEIAERLGCKRSNITKRLNDAGYSGRKSKKEDINLRNRISSSLIGRYVGEDNPNYKGYTDEKTLARGLFKTLSKKIMRERNYTCEICGQRGGDLEVHHIIPFSEIMNDFFTNEYDGNIFTLYKQLANYKPFMDENNLAVLCKECHKRIHSKDNHEPSPYLKGKVQRLSLNESRSQANGDRNAEALLLQESVI